MKKTVRIFIASSQKHINIANAIKYNLDNNERITAFVWDETTFDVGEYLLDSLIKQTRNCDYAIFIFAPDDQLLIANQLVHTVRDNVLFELGLFIGILGRKKCFAIIPADFTIRIASDLKGIQLERYYMKYDESQLISATKGACVNIIKKINKEIDQRSSTDYNIFNPISFLGLTSGKTAIIYHCEDINKYHKYSLNPTGITLQNRLNKFMDDLNCNIFSLEGCEFSVLLKNVTDFETLFVVDSPPYNGLSEFLIQNYKKHLIGGSLKSYWTNDQNRILQSIILKGTNNALKSNKYETTDEKDAFGYFDDHIVIMRLPWIFPNNKEQIEILNANKLIWLIFGLHTKGTYAGLSIFKEKDIEPFVKNIKNIFKGVIPKYFEVIYKVTDKKAIVDSYNDLDLVHHSELIPKVEIALQDNKPTNLEFYFSDRYPNFPISQVPIHSVHLDIGSACNFKCPNCIERDIRKLNMMLSFKKVIDILCDLKKANCHYVNFYGGEPTLHPDFIRILTTVDTMGFKSLLVTNGSQLFRKDIMAAVLDATNLHIRVSLDAQSNATHFKNHGLRNKNKKYFDSIRDSIVLLLKTIHSQNKYCTSISISCLLYNNLFENEELLKACEFWRKNGATSFHLRPVSNLHGKISDLATLHSKRFLIQHILDKYKNFVITPEWFKDYISKNEIEIPKQKKEFSQCYSAYYRFAISPNIIPNKKYKNISISGIDKKVVISNDAMISLCTYNRMDPKFSVVYPNNFINWLSTQRIDKATLINPKLEPCRSALCCRYDLNLETAQNISII